MVHYTCIFHMKRIKTRTQQRLGAPALWEKVLQYCDATYSQNDFCCQQCYRMLRDGKDPRIVINAKISQPVAIHQSQDGIITSSSSISQMESISSSESVSEFSEIENFSYDNVQSTSVSTDSNNSESSFSSNSTLSVESTNEIKEEVSYFIPSVTKTQSKCFICGSRQGRCRIPKEARVMVFMEKKIIIPKTNRVCRHHLTEHNSFTETAMSQIVSTVDETSLSPEEMTQFVLEIREVACITKYHLDFDREEMCDENYEVLLGITKENFKDLFSYCSGNLRRSTNRSPKNALALFLMKMRGNYSQTVLAILFGCSSQVIVSDTLKAVSSALIKTFVPQNLGYSPSHMSRETFHDAHQVNLPYDLFDAPKEVVFAVLDATYLFIDKPGDFESQRRTYSGHKYRNLVKPMMVVGTDGYILAAEGNYFADGGNNDAGILKHMMRNDVDGFKSFFNPGDYLVLDRGFRDCTEDLERNNFNVLTPHCLKKGQSQFTVDEANFTRCVTMVRFVVEAVNGRIKNKFAMFNQQNSPICLDSLMEYFKIACAISNKYFAPIQINKEDHVRIAKIVNEKLSCVNEVQEHIDQLGLAKKKVCFEKADESSVTNFPTLSEDDLKMITLGTYQIRMASRYTKQQFDVNPCYILEIYKEEPNLIRSRINSRFSKRNKHQSWISYDETKCGMDGILGHYCTCKVGARVVGCCSHIASIIWYLGYARHDESRMPRYRASTKTILDAAAALVDYDQGSESESDYED